MGIINRIWVPINLIFFLWIHLQILFEMKNDLLEGLQSVKHYVKNKLEVSKTDRLLMLPLFHQWNKKANFYPHEALEHKLILKCAFLCSKRSATFIIQADQKILLKDWINKTAVLFPRDSTGVNRYGKVLKEFSLGGSRKPVRTRRIGTQFHQISPKSYILHCWCFAWAPLANSLHFLSLLSDVNLF